jgi:hypothetical protein
MSPEDNGIQFMGFFSAIVKSIARNVNFVNADFVAQVSFEKYQLHVGCLIVWTTRKS